MHTLTFTAALTLAVWQVHAFYGTAHLLGKLKSTAHLSPSRTPGTGIAAVAGHYGIQRGARGALYAPKEPREPHLVRG